MQSLSEIEWTLIWASTRYFLGRRTIAAASFPTDIVKYYYERMNPLQKKTISDEIYAHAKEFGWIGDKNIDHRIWMKFAAALDTENHFNKVLSDGFGHTLFIVEGRTYPLREYLQKPYMEIFIREEEL